MYILQKMFAFSPETHTIKWRDPICIMAIFAVMEFILIAQLDRKLLKNIRFYRYLEPFLLGALMIFTILYRGEGHGFIYFQF